MDIAKTLQYYSGNSNSTYSVGETYDSLHWHTTNTLSKPSETDLRLCWELYKLQRESLKYKELRANAYPSIIDQLDILYHQGYDGWKTAIKAVKDKYPKPINNKEEL